MADFGRLTITAVTLFERPRGYRLAIRDGKPFERQLQAFEALVANCIGFLSTRKPLAWPPKSGLQLRAVTVSNSAIS